MPGATCQLTEYYHSDLGHVRGPPLDIGGGGLAFLPIFIFFTSG